VRTIFDCGLLRGPLPRLTSRHAVSFLALTALLSAPSIAAEAEGDEAAASNTDTVVVIGNRSRATTALESPAPIDVIDGAQLAALGANTSLRDALSVLLPSFNQLTVSSSSWNSVARPAGLRGLGGSHVLVLVNGKRRHNSSLLNLSTGSVDAGANSVDLDLIPASAIARLEVLRDGAAAQYGSDAIAGVINIVLKSNAQGGSLSVNAGQRYAYRGKSDGRNLEVGGDIGFRLPNEGFLTLSAQAKDANSARRSVPATGAFYYPLANGSPDPRESRDKTVFAGGLPDLRSLTLLYNAELPLAGGATLYSSSTWSTRDAIVGQNFRRPNSTNAVLSIFPDGYAPNYTLSENDFQVLAGIKGEAGGWRWDLSSTYGENETRNGASNSLNASLGATSPTSFNTFTARFAQWTNNADISRSFDVGLADALRVSFGAEHRFERFQTIAGDRAAYANGFYVYPSGPLAGRPATVGAQGAIVLTPADEARLSRNSFAGYIDVGINPVPQWFVAVAGRVEHYDDSAGDTVSGKFTTRYDFNDVFAIRGTVSNGFRAPALAQSGFAQTSNQYNIVNGVSTFVTSKSVQAESAIGAALGARPLKPERSFNLSAGFTVRLDRRFDLTVDAYQIQLDDRIAQTGFLSGAAVDRILVSNGFEAGQSVRYFANAVDTRTRGIEAVVNYTQPLGADNRLRLSAGYNYNKTTITKIAGSPPELAALNLTLFDRAAQGNLDRNLPRSKLILSQDLTLGKVHVNLRETRFGKVALLNVTPAFDQFFGAKWIVDLDASYQLTRNVNVAVGANNLFNTYPDKNQIADTNGFPPYPAQSPFGFYGGYYYGRLSISF
jgi:iron complex outermembrane receptor protein